MLETLTQARLKEVLIYEPDSGHWFWRVGGRGLRAGKRLPIPPRGNYHRIRIDRIGYRAHRLAWLYMTGEWPTHQIDHINGEPSDNRWCNLRSASNQENAQNIVALRSDNTSGARGVARYSHGWRAYIAGRHLGSFPTKEEAMACYRGASIILYGQFSPHYDHNEEARKAALIPGAKGR